MSFIFNHRVMFRRSLIACALFAPVAGFADLIDDAEEAMMQFERINQEPSSASSTQKPAPQTTQPHSPVQQFLPAMQQASQGTTVRSGTQPGSNSTAQTQPVRTDTQSFLSPPRSAQPVQAVRAETQLSQPGSRGFVQSQTLGSDSMTAQPILNRGSQQKTSVSRQVSQSESVATIQPVHKSEVSMSTLPNKDNVNYGERFVKSNGAIMVSSSAAGIKQSDQVTSSSKATTHYSPANYAPLSSGMSASGDRVEGPSEAEIRNIMYRASQIALGRSPELRGAKYDAEAARANVGEAKGQRWPQVDVGSSSPSLQFGGGDKTKQSDLPALTMNMSTTLYDFGQTSSTIDSREHMVDAADNGINAQREDTAWQVSNGLTELSKQRLIIGLSEQYVARMAKLVDMLSGIVEADPGRRSELTQAKGKLLQAQSSKDTAIAKTRDIEITLVKLIGDTQVPLPPNSQWNLTPGSTDRLLRNIEQHPVIKKAQAEAKAALSQVDAVKASSMPKLSWTVSKSTGEDQFGRQQAWQTGVNVSWAIFRGGSSRAAELAAVHQAESSREKIEQQLRDLEYRVRTADQDARSMLERAALYQDLSVESDRIRLAFFDQWYHLGKRTLLDVLSAESDFYNNQVSEVTNRFDAYSAIFRGHASAGQLLNWLRTGKN